MTKNIEQKQDLFIEMRTNGQSYNSIAKKLKVSKSTLIKWSREFRNEINNAKALELESLREEIRQHNYRYHVLN